LEANLKADEDLRIAKELAEKKLLEDEAKTAEIAAAVALEKKRQEDALKKAQEEKLAKELAEKKRLEDEAKAAEIAVAAALEKKR